MTNTHMNYSNNESDRKDDNIRRAIDSDARNIRNNVDYNGNSFKSMQKSTTATVDRIDHFVNGDFQSQPQNDSISAFAQDTEHNDDDNFIKCIFLCKFHAIAGPQIAAQVPNNYIPKDVFDTISQYVIPKSQLQRCFLSA